jgi:hypothetical protein
MTGPASSVLAHIAGAPLKETVLFLAPLLALGGWGYLRALAERRLRKEPHLRRRDREPA